MRGLTLVLLMGGLMACEVDEGADLGVVDRAVPDAAVADAEVGDRAVSDGAPADGARPDMIPVDAAVPDAEIPDAAVPDAEIPDAAVPDAEIPDAAVPDAEIPDAAVPDAEIPNPCAAELEGAPCAEALCDGAVRVVARCDAASSCVEERSPCGDGEICDGGACFRPEPLFPCRAPNGVCDAPACVDGVRTDFACDADLRCRRIDTRCPAGERCIGGVCGPGPECQVPGERCGEPGCVGDVRTLSICDDTLRCTELAAPCGEGFRCVGGGCAPASPDCAAADQGCAGRACEGSDVVVGVCDADLACVGSIIPCAPGTGCQGGDCLPDASTFECAFRGQSCNQPPRCVGGAEAFAVCEPGDGGLVCEEQVRACADGETCREGFCTPDGPCFAAGLDCGEATCVGGDAVRFVCDDDLRCRPRAEPCDGGWTCLGGRCAAAECAVDVDCGRPECSGIDAVLEFDCFDGICAPDIEPCPEGTVCQGGRCGGLQVVEACRVEGEACGPSTCEGPFVRGFTCQRDAPDAPLECRASASTCARGTTCRDGFCVIDDGFCATPGDPCGDDACLGDAEVRFECDADRRCLPFVFDCAPGEQCSDGRCRTVGAPQCLAPGEACRLPGCDGNVRVVGRCDIDLTCVEERFPCGDDQVCDGGVCFQLTPGQACAAIGDRCAEPQCEGETLVDFRCGPDLRCRRTERACPDGQVCSGGACAPAVECPVPGVQCGEPGCFGPSSLAVPTCSDDLTCVDREQGCGPGFRCEAGVCLPVSEDCAAEGQVCGALACAGDALSAGICNAALECVVQTAPCPPATRCADGICAAALCRRPRGRDVVWAGRRGRLDLPRERAGMCRRRELPRGLLHPRRAVLRPWSAVR